jgi:N4-gp56 family major capsid protein
MAATPGTTTTTPLLLPQYYDDLLMDNLYPQLYYYQFGEKRRVPQGSGKNFFIPRFQKKDIVGGVTEGTVIDACAISAQRISGVITSFAGAYLHSDFLVMTSISSVIEGSLREIGKNIASDIDEHIRDQLTGVQATAGSTFVGGNGVTSSNSVQVADVIRAQELIRAEVLLDAEDNFRFPDGTYAAIVHPKQTFDLQASQVSAAGSWVDINKYTSNVETIYRGEIGRMYGCRVVTSTKAKRLVLGSHMSGTASGYMAHVLAPGAYHVVELEGGMAQTYVKGLGSAGTADPVNQLATVGAKVFFQALANTLDTRRANIHTGATIQ